MATGRVVHLPHRAVNQNADQLTDAIKILVEEKYKVYYREIKGKHIDVGTINDLKNANTFLSQH